MSKTIAVAGKGGVGMTSISSRLIHELSLKGLVLAIDADPSTNLHQALGLPLGATIGGIREELDDQIKTGTFSAGITKNEFLQLRVREALVESDRIDLLAMGRPEGPGCYCAVNNILRSSIDQIEKDYDYIVIDSEAGTEHISRQTTKNVDALIIVSDPTIRGLTAAVGIRDLMDELREDTGKTMLVVNRVAKRLSGKIESLIAEKNMGPAFKIAEDDELYDLESEGLPLNDLPEESVFGNGVQRLVSMLEL